ncbi:hypothetical protein LCL96_17460 [Rossellomorea aquimaris]|uniref:hypothetical protein n=1 Tax=Rossellomorea TaxID=2837508 RepID=UPI001CD79FEE|nr:hypothetical protein [Rossellomorea aquimaris]MCA1060728.1 hypothetical protein [Rossellomorea aquimaris]
MSEKNNPLEEMMDLIGQYTKEDGSKLDFESVKDKLSSLFKEDSQGKGSVDVLGSLGNLGAVGNMMNVLPMLEKVVRQHMNKYGCCKTHKQNCKNDLDDIKELLEDILDELKKIKKCTCHKKKHGCYKDNWEHWY